MDQVIKISAGKAQAVYSDELQPVLAEMGDTTVTRASHVEPADTIPNVPNRLTGWVADMRPSGGPVLTAPDGNGFPTRQAALDAERDWLRRERGL